MDKSEKFYHVYPVLSMFMQVAVCFCLCIPEQMQCKLLEKHRLWGELFQLFLWENP